jgi:hypothetical protein
LDDGLWLETGFGDGEGVTVDFVGMEVAVGVGVPADTTTRVTCSASPGSTVTATVPSPFGFKPSGGVTLRVYFPGSRSPNENLPSAPVLRASDFEPNVRRTSALATGFVLPPPSTTTVPLIEPLSLSAAKASGATPGLMNASASPRTIRASGRHANVSVRVRMSYSRTRR